MVEVVTKAELARRFGVDRSAVTRWEDRGLPVRSDGRVDLTAAMRWTHRNLDSTTRHYRQKREGRRTVAEVERQSRVDAGDELARIGIWLLAQRMPGMVAALAVEAGLPVKAARRMHDLALVRAAELANDVRDRWMSLPPGEMGPFRTIDPEFLPVDWGCFRALAAASSGEARKPRQSRPGSV